MDLYREAGHRAGHAPEQLQVGLHSLGYIADSNEQTVAEFYPGYAQTFPAFGKERGWPPVTRAQFDAVAGPRGALLMGGPDEVAEKINHHS